MKNIESRIDSLISQMTLEEKVSFCAGSSCMQGPSLPRLGIQPLEMSDGPNGVRATGQPGSENTTALPTGIALAASFDCELAEKYGKAIALDSRALGIGASLGPALNLMRTPLCGRNFEYYGEDPVLAGRIAAGYVRGCQKEKVAATPKHLALNNQEICRTTGSSDIDERTLRELYLTAFEIITKESSPWMMMSSYNRINGTYASENGFTQELIVKQEWGFDGVMVSDWGGAHDTLGCALGGLDLEMPGTGVHLTPEKLLPLFRSGTLPESLLDDKVRRVLRLLCRTEAIDGFSPSGECGGKIQQDIARETAEKSVTLLKNSDAILPLDCRNIRKIVVTGPNADYRHHRGNLRLQGGSGAVFSEREVTPLAGLQQMAAEKGMEIIYIPAVKFAHDRSCPAGFFGEKGIHCTYYPDVKSMQEKRDMLIEEYNRTGSFEFKTADDNTVAAQERPEEVLLPSKGFAMRMSAKIVLPENMNPEAEILFNTPSGNCIVKIDGQVVWDNSTEEPCGRFQCPTGKQFLDMEIEYSISMPCWAHFRIDWNDPQADILAGEKVFEAAKDADLVIFCGGRHKLLDKEAIGWGDVPGADVPSLTMPDGQDEFICRLAEINPRTIVTLTGGSVMDVEKWIDKVPALLQLWYPGEAGGTVLADILTGKVNPSGRLPMTWAKNLNDYACHGNGNYPGNRTDEDPHVRYDEGIFMGYRHFDRAGIASRFPFGYGLSYSEFASKISSFEVTGSGCFDAGCRVEAEVSNLSGTAGTETVQIYVGAVSPEFERPEKELKAFAKVALAPGESKKVSFELKWRDFAAFHPAKHHWCVPAGDYRIVLASDGENILDSRIITIA